MLESLAQHVIYSASGRNYGAYNATVTQPDGSFYTVFFTIERNRGSLGGQRYRFLMRIESAYINPQIGKKNRITLAGIFSKM